LQIVVILENATPHVLQSAPVLCFIMSLNK
jgi:hypothetical protein